MNEKILIFIFFLTSCIPQQVQKVKNPDEQYGRGILILPVNELLDKRQYKFPSLTYPLLYCVFSSYFQFSN